MSNHTPGPWKMVGWNTDEHGNLIARVCYFDKRGKRRFVCDVEKDANARLISVAPEMLEFLQLLADYFRAGSTPLYGDGFLTSDNRPPLETIENLIRKATE